MQRTGYGQSHKLKGSMRMGLAYPVYRAEMVPGEIRRISPEVFIQSVVPPTVQLTDNIKWKIEFGFVPTRLVDDTFVKNITTSKDGTVKGNFKTLSLDQIQKEFGSALKGYTPTRALIDGSGKYITSQIPEHFKEFKLTSNGVADHEYRFVSNNNGLKRMNYKATISGNSYDYNECLPYGIMANDVSNVHVAPYFGQGSLMDWLGLEPNGNIGINGKTGDGIQDFTFNTWSLSAYYMLMNFWHTKPEYEKYIAPHFDYVYTGRDNSENRSTLHRYETLEEEFGNGFEEPHLCGRCVNGLVIDNWVDDYFSKTMKTPQRGIAPVVPVSVTGSSVLRLKDTNGNSLNSQSTLTLGTTATGALATTVSGTNYYGYASAPNAVSDSAPSLSGSFVISDLRSALALQHFQEDTQDCFKWSDWLQKVYGISPSDNTLDEPQFLGACEGYLSSDAVVSTSSTTGAELGELGGKLGTFSSNNKMITYRAEEHGVLMAIMTIKPERNYESGVDKMFMRRNYLDMYFKYLTGIGNQAISVQEVCAVPFADPQNTNNRDSNWGFTSRFEEFRHSRNRIVGKCRNDNMVLPILKYTSGAPAIDHYDTLKGARDSSNLVPYLNTFHPYAIGDSYFSAKTGLVIEGAVTNRGLRFNENSQNFLLCCPQLNDIFVDDTEEPFMCVVGFKSDVLSPIPQFTSPGVSYV